MYVWSFKRWYVSNNFILDHLLVKSCISYTAFKVPAFAISMLVETFYLSILPTLKLKLCALVSIGIYGDIIFM